MSTTLLQYPPSPSSRNRDSYLSIANSRHESMISTSAASYETALAGSPSVVSRTGSIAGDGTSSVIGSPQAGPATLLPKEYNDSIPSIQTARVSQDAHGSPSPAPRVVGNGKAIVEALEPAAIAAYPIQYVRPDTVNLPKQQMAARNPAVVEGPNGLTPPPSPPTTESFRLRSGAPILGGPTVEEPLPVDLEVARPTTPNKFKGDFHAALSEYES
jgi:hypothetical protein